MNVADIIVGDWAEQSSLNVPRDWLLVSEWVWYKIMTNYDQMTQKYEHQLKLLYLVRS